MRNFRYLFVYKGSSAVRRLIKGALSRVGLDIRRSMKPRTTKALANTNTEFTEPYLDNPPAGAVSFAEKLERASSGGFFEWPNIVALNLSVASMVGSSRRIVELGGGTGCFAYEVSADPNRFVLCSELEEGAHKWAKENRQRANIHYINRIPDETDGRFDLVVSIEVIEHVQDFRSFLSTCTKLAPKAILSTPNKNRDRDSSSRHSPEYLLHVREWTAGEFYWVLRNYYHNVKLFAMPDVYVPKIVPIRVIDSMTPLIAVCENPIDPISSSI